MRKRMRKINWWWTSAYAVTTSVAIIFQDIQMSTYVGVMLILCGKALEE